MVDQVRFPRKVSPSFSTKRIKKVRSKDERRRRNPFHKALQEKRQLNNSDRQEDSETALNSQELILNQGNTDAIDETETGAIHPPDKQPIRKVIDLHA